VEELEHRDLFSAYYISPSGSDSNSGTSPDAPWQTIDKVNASFFRTGDAILFQGGQTFTGNIALNAQQEPGTGAAPITIGSYDSGRAIIQASDNTLCALTAYDDAGLTISDLVFVGSGSTANNTAGIYFLDDLPGGQPLGHVYITDVDVSGFGFGGIAFQGTNQTPGYIDVAVTYSRLHDNGMAGFLTWGDPASISYFVTNLYIGHVTAFGNISNPSYPSSGFGLLLKNVADAVVERCETFNNGPPNSSGPDAGAGIVANTATGIVLQYNESYANTSGNQVDGMGFDFDRYVTASIMQFNYSHDNDGAGFVDCGCMGPANYVTFRFNISENDARRLGASGGILVYGTPANADIYGNTVFLADNGTGQTAALYVNGYPSSVQVRDNVFVTTGGVPLVDVNLNPSGLTFQGNDYWPSDGTYAFDYEDATYPSLAAWQASTGQEMLDGSPVGFAVDPQLTAPGQGGTIGNPDLLDTLTAYRLLPASPLLGQGLNLAALFGLQTGTEDYYDNPLPAGNSTPNPGADQTVPPTAVIAPLAVLTEGQPLTLDASASTDLDGHPLTYSWDVNGDGVYGDATGPTPTLTWAQLQLLGYCDGATTYTIHVQVVDNYGFSAVASTTLTVAVVAPTVQINGAASSVEGSTYTLLMNAGYANDPDGDVITGWTITWGDGSLSNVPGNPTSVAHQFAGVGTYSISAAALDDDGSYAASAIQVAVQDAPLQLTPQPFTATAAIPFNGIVAQFTDPGSDGTVGDYTATISWGDGQSSAGTITAGSGSLFTIAGTNTYVEEGNYAVSISLQDIGGASASASSVATVAPAAAAQIVLTASPNTIAGTGIDVTVQVEDALGHTVPGYTGTVHFTSTDPEALLPADYTFTTADAGVHTFSNGVVLKTAGPETITATDTVVASLVSTALVVVKPGVAAQLIVAAPPSSAIGAPFTVTVTALDAYGNVAAGYTGTVHFRSSDGQAKLPSDYTFTSADAGVHTFVNSVTLKTAGSQTVTATDTTTRWIGNGGQLGGGHTITASHKTTNMISGSATVNVQPGMASRLPGTGPASTVAGAAFPSTGEADIPGHRCRGRWPGYVNDEEMHHRN
jgi:hypothetical protein